jgi:hypothetical protein
LPLLYVDAGSVGAAGNGIFSTTSEVDLAIEQIVQNAISTVVYNKDPTDLDGIGQLEFPEPIMLPFRGLELQGSDNSVLYAVGYNINDASPKKDKDYDEDGVYIVDDWTTANKESGYEKLQQLVKAIQSDLEKKGYKTFWPSDDPQGNELLYDDDATLAALRAKQKKWRPRVPFVRLPSDFYDDLTQSEFGLDDMDAYFSKGFDGISPLFWYDAWADEDILPSPGVRMRSVQVYRRMMSGGGEGESSFYELPSSSAPGDGNESMDLPAGNAKLMEKEQKAKAKEMERMGEVESEAEREWEEGKARMLSDDVQVEVRKDFAEFDVSIETGDVVVDEDAAYSSPWTERGVDPSIIEAASDAAANESTPPSDASAEEIVDQSQSQSQQPSTTKRKLPSIEDNPVFQRLWKGEAQLNAQGESTAQPLDGTSAAEEVLPPYPSDEYFTGIWKVVQSPIGVPSFEDASSQSSDNLILRVDGQVMGGPILDAEFQHKAAGGSWKMFQAVQRSGNDGADEPKITQTRLRIKLLVPPEKERMLVMEGEVTRVGFAGKAPTSSSAFAGTGGMLEGMSTAKLLKDDETPDTPDGEQVLYCGGEAWMENVDGSGKRRKLGPFSLTKQKTVDRSKLIYTVPASRGGLDPDDESN